MANPEHVDIVKQGVEKIRKWIELNPGILLDLQSANLSGANLSGLDLLDPIKGFLTKVDLSGANLAEADLANTNLPWVNLSGADLSKAFLLNANLNDANLSGTNLAGAILFMSNLSRTNLSEAELFRAGLFGANLFQANLFRAELSEAKSSNTSFSNCDLSSCSGLDKVEHESPSSIGVDTLLMTLRGAGGAFTKEQLAFFKGAGVPEELLNALPRIIAEVKYSNCFISYGQLDGKLATKLREDLTASGITCWLYELDSTPGVRTWQEISMKRREAENMVLLCSAEALVRDGVLKELEEQIDENPDKIIPISLDDLWKHPGFRVMRGQRDLKPFLLDRNYADFANMEYAEALKRLLRGLERKND